MKKSYKYLLLALTLFTIANHTFAQSNLKPCEGAYSKKWTNCFGVIDYGTGWSHSAEFKNGLANGQGTFKDINGDTYVGQWKEHMQQGQGTKTYANGDKYVGQWKEDKQDGQGTYTYSNGDKFVGQFKNNVREGQGKMTYVDCCMPFMSVSGGSYVGQYKNNKEEGQGTRIFHDGAKYVGQFKNGLRDGQGTMLYVSGAKYEGQWKEDSYDGQGTFMFVSGGKYVGQWKEDKFNGQGTYTSKDGEIIIGIWENDKLVKDESPLPPVITLSCPNDNGRMKGVEFQYLVNPKNNTVVSSRGQSPSNIVITPTLIQFQQGEFFTTINRVSGFFSTVLNANVAGSGTCVAIDQLKPKF